jgi:hypothetical protein
MSEVDEVVRAISEENRAAKASVIPQEGDNPDNAARALDLSNHTGVPAFGIYGDLDTFERNHKATLTQALLDQNQHLKDFALSHPLAPKIAEDDWHQLDAASEKITKLGFPGGMGTFHAPTEALDGSLLSAVATGFSTGYHEGAPVGKDTEDFLNYLANTPLKGFATEPWRTLTGSGAFGLELFMRALQGSLYAGGNVATEAFKQLGLGNEAEADRFRRDIIQGLMVGLSGQAGPGWTVGLHPEIITQINEASLAARPYALAGKPPPVGIHPIIDEIHKIQAEIDATNLHEALQESQRSATRERAPELYANFVRQHTEGTIGISADAIRKLYGEKEPAPEDGVLGWIPGLRERLRAAEATGGDVEVPVADWLAKVDKEVAKGLEDDIRVRANGLTVNEAKEMGEQKAEQAKLEPSLEQDNVPPDQGPPRPTIADLATLDPEELDRRLRKVDAEHPEFRQVPFGVDPEFIQKLSYDDYQRVLFGDPVIRPVRVAAGLEPMLERPAEKKLELSRLGKPQPMVEGDPEMAHDFSIRVGDEEVGSLHLSEQKEGKVLHVDFIQAHKIGGANSLGPRQIRSLFEQIQAEFPNAEMIEGSRISGARRKADATGPAQVSLRTRAEEGLKDFTDLIRGAAEKVQEERGTWIDYGPKLKARIKPAKAYTEAEVKLVDEVDKVAARLAPKGDLATQEAHSIEMRDRRIYGAYQEYTQAPPVVLWSLLSPDPIGTMRHEVIHYLRGQGFFTPEEWNTLKQAAIDGDWLGKHDIRERYQGLGAGHMIEEAIAEEFKDWAGRPDSKHVAGELFERLKEFVEKAIEAITKALGYKPSAEDLFTMVETGEIGKREPSGPLDPTTFKGQEESLFDKASAVGMTVDQYRRYLRKIEQRSQEDAERQIAKHEGDIRQRQTLEWKNNEARVRSEVEADIKQRPDLAVDAFLSEGRIGDKQVVEKPKLDASLLTPEQKAILPKGSYGRGGLDPDSVAGFFGYQSAEAMINRWSLLENARRAQRLSPEEYVKKVTDAEVERRMERTYGNLDENILREAQEHVISDTQLDLLHEETLALGLKAGSKLPIEKGEIKAWAKSEFDKTPIAGLSMDKFLAEAGRAGRAAEMALLKDDFAEAFRQKQRQYIAVLIADNAKKLVKAQDRFETLAKRFSKREVPGVLPEYTNFIHDILMRTGQQVRRSVQDLQAAIEASGYENLEAFVDAKQADLREVPVADFLLDPNWRKGFKDLTAGEFAAVHDSIKTLAKNGRDELKIIKDGEARDLAEVRDQLVAALEQFPEKPRVETAKGRQKWLYGLKTFHASLLQIEALFNRWAQDDPKHPWNDIAIIPLADAASHKAQLERKFARMVQEAKGSTKDLDKQIDNPLFIDPHSVSTDAKGRPQMDDPNGTPMIMTRRKLRGIMMYLGRKEGREKLERGNGVKVDQVVDWVNRVATKEDWDYVNKIGEVYAQTKALADRMYRRMSGVAPESAELVPLQTPHGNFDGFYTPIRYDKTFEGTSAKLKGPKDLMEENYVRATTPAGYTKKVTGYSAPLSFDIDEIPNHIMGVLHDIAFREAVVEASKLYYDTKIRNTIVKHYGQQYRDLLVPFLKDVANSANFQSAGQAVFKHWSEFFRQNIIGTLIGFNIRTVQKHTLTAAMNSMTEVGPLNFARAAHNLMSVSEDGTNSNWNFALEKSAELQRRHRNFRETIRGSQEDVLDDTSWRNTMLKAGSAPVAFFDLLSAVPTFLAEYRGQIEAGGTEGAAISAADRAVRRAHGSTAITNRPRFMREHPWLSSLYGFFNHMYNRQFELAWKAGEAAGALTKGNASKLRQYGGQLGIGLFSYVIFPALVEEMVTPMTNDQHESWGKWGFKTIAKGIASSVPVVRDLADFILSGGVQHEPSVGMLTPMIKSVVDVTRDFPGRGEKAFDHQHAGSTVQHAVTAMGALTGLAPKEFGNAAKFVIDWKNHQVAPKGPGDIYQGLTTGRLKGRSDIIGRGLRTMSGERDRR